MAVEVVVESVPRSWLTNNITPILALVVVVGGGWVVVFSNAPDVRLGVTTIVTMVISYYFGTSSGIRAKDKTIENLAETSSDIRAKDKTIEILSSTAEKVNDTPTR
jgi:uncharacterized protein YacL